MTDFRLSAYGLFFVSHCLSQLPDNDSLNVAVFIKLKEDQISATLK